MNDPFTRSFVELFDGQFQRHLRLFGVARFHGRPHAFDVCSHGRTNRAIAVGSLNRLTNSFFCLFVICHVYSSVRDSR